MIKIKNSAQIAGIKSACIVASKVLNDLKILSKPGITTYDLDCLAKDLIANYDAESACYNYSIGSRRFPGYVCLSVNEEVVHGIGSIKRVLKQGDVLSIDVVVKYKGYIGDTAVTVVVGETDAATNSLLDITRKALAIGISKAQVGNKIGDISHSIQNYVESYGFSVVRDMVGHGVGLSMHEEPQIPNFGRPNVGPKIKPGMTLAIEPMVNMGTHKTITLEDGWTVVTADKKNSAHFEHTILTTETGPEILTNHFLQN